MNQGPGCLKYVCVHKVAITFSRWLGKRDAFLSFLGLSLFRFAVFQEVYKSGQFQTSKQILTG